jgi:hypothetical protein
MVAAPPCPPCPPCPPVPPNPWTLLTFADLGTATAAGTGTVSDPGTDATLRLQRASGSGTTPWYWTVDSILGGANFAVTQQVIEVSLYARWRIDVGQASPFAGAVTSFAVSLGARFAASGLAARTAFGWVGVSGSANLHYLPACNAQQYTAARTPAQVLEDYSEARMFSAQETTGSASVNRFGRGTARIDLRYWRWRATGNSLVSSAALGTSEPEGACAVSAVAATGSVPSPAGVTIGASTGSTAGAVDATAAIWYRVRVLDVTTAGLPYPPTLVTP